MGVVHKPNPDWASHIPVLIKALEISEGPVLELGAGIFSTPLLHTLCAAEGRQLSTYESEKEYADMFRLFRTPGHTVAWAEEWWPGSPDDWSVVFVDNKPAAQRKEDIKKVTQADYVLIHDSEDPLYGYDEIYPLFAYRYDYKKFKTWTTVLSNKHELDIFSDTFDK